MKLFKCTNCGHPVYFENIYCVQCNAVLGFVPETLQLISLNRQHDGLYSSISASNITTYKYCWNHRHNVCNWLIPGNSISNFCVACELNRMIPDLNQREYVERWGAIEVAKHRLIYQLLRMKLPLISKMQDEQTGLVFDFKSDETTDDDNRVLTGHDNGVITINIAEADDIEREMARRQMDEVYRTLLGHFRHEIGHYYWDRLIDNTNKLQEFRVIFGDETIDYAEALQRHYREGSPANWSAQYISAYASVHPWEDWAETWAHYMHIIDTLETAYSFGLSFHPLIAEATQSSSEIISDPYAIKDFNIILQRWLPLTFALNSLNRSMGLKDIYPFVINAAVVTKMQFIHKVVLKAATNE